MLEVDGFIPYLPMSALSLPASASDPSGSSGPAPVQAGIPSEEAQVAEDDEEEALEEDEVPVEPTASEKMRADAQSLSHLMTHARKNPYCPKCQRARLQAKPHLPKHRRGKCDNVAENFGDIVIADHAIFPTGESGKGGERVSLILPVHSGLESCFCLRKKCRNRPHAMRQTGAFVRKSVASDRKQGVSNFKVTALQHHRLEATAKKRRIRNSGPHGQL